MDFNRPKYRRNQEKSPQISERKVACWNVHRDATQLGGSVQRERCQRETLKTTITAFPSIEEFREQRGRKRKPADDADKRVKKPTTSTLGVNDPQLELKPEVPTWKFFAPMRSTELEADHGDL
jgi:hypothetical protein